MQILTANELLSGASVYFGRDRRWHQDIHRARIFAEADAQELDAVIAAAGATTRLVSIAVEKVQVKAGRVVAHRLRERIRAEGPTSPRHVLQPLREGDHVSL
ncbi:MAG: DUF2849 domain-containing protein [Hyphomicrobiaceae bacterium]|nr:DUF2849 domain-containing protein [Hyphomicrobiaceae bacterium]MCC0024768.1 DUF2849 domain-containing protein [Hyphomicrobiaceae bacterium]